MVPRRASSQASNLLDVAIGGAEASGARQLSSWGAPPRPELAHSIGSNAFRFSVAREIVCYGVGQLSALAMANELDRLQLWYLGQLTVIGSTATGFPLKHRQSDRAGS
jgi:hypothetical protein